ncbi:MAG: MFS transporter [Burkholderiales bacterium]|nr:MFS transporter [Burkholderiales bacterium]
MSTSFATVVSQVLAATPLRHPAFRGYYFGSIGIALGYTMQATMAAWLMTTLTPSALMVALVQTMSTAPAILFGLVAGALADIVERRHVLLVTSIALLAGTVVLGLVTLAGLMTPWALLVLTFVIGAAFMFYVPAAQASINELVARVEVPKAVALGAIAMNVSRAVGPALAGALTAWIGSGSAFLASAVFFTGMIFVVRSWQPQPPALPGIPETLLGGIFSGLRFLRHSAPMRAIMLRNLTFCFCASAVYALLPVIARDQLDLGAGGFGLLFGCFGAGAVVASLNLPAALGKHSLQRMVVAASLLFVIACTLLAATGIPALAMIGTFGCGAAWAGVLVSLSAGTQSVAPAWVRARMAGMSFVTAQTALAVGSVLWGVVATWRGTRVSLLAAAVTFLALLALHRRVRVRLGGEKDVLPGAQAGEIAVLAEPEPDDGPVLIQIEYRILPQSRDAFLRAMRAMGPLRRRNGALSWRVFRDLGQDGVFVERYIVSSWAEYVRLRSRMTVADWQRIDEVSRHQREGAEIRVSRFLGVDLPEGRQPAARK